MTKVSYKYKVWFLILMNHVLMIIGIYYAITESSYYLFIVLFIGLLLSKLGGEIGTHRYLSHRSFKTGPIRNFILQIMGLINCNGSPMTWAILHRYHHMNADKPEEPHSPNIIRWWKCWLTLWNPISPNPKEYMDLLKDPLVKNIHKYYFYMIILMFGILYLLDWRLLVFLVCIPSVITFHGSTLLINTISQKCGYRNFDTDDNSRNNTRINFLIWGGGLHNNHHAYPERYNEKVTDNERDPCGWIIEKFFKI